MELVNPDGSKVQVPPAVEEGKEKSPDVKQEEPPKAPFTCTIDEKGTMHIDAILPVCVHNDGLLCMFRGFMDEKRDEAVLSIKNARAEMAKQRATLVKANNAGMFNGFLRKIGRK